LVLKVVETSKIVWSYEADWTKEKKFLDEVWIPHCIRSTNISSKWMASKIKLLESYRLSPWFHISQKVVVRFLGCLTFIVIRSWAATHTYHIQQNNTVCLFQFLYHLIIQCRSAGKPMDHNQFWFFTFVGLLITNFVELTLWTNENGVHCFKIIKNNILLMDVLHLNTTKLENFSLSI
jgi:hypothetical protein